MSHTHSRRHRPPNHQSLRHRRGHTPQYTAPAIGTAVQSPPAAQSRASRFVARPTSTIHIRSPQHHELPPAAAAAVHADRHASGRIACTARLLAAKAESEDSHCSVAAEAAAAAADVHNAGRPIGRSSTGRRCPEPLGPLGRQRCDVPHGRADVRRRAAAVGTVGGVTLQFTRIHYMYMLTC